MKIKAVIHPAEEGGYWAEVPALPGCVTEGDTMEEVLANLKDAIEGWLYSRFVVALSSPRLITGTCNGYFKLILLYDNW